MEMIECSRCGKPFPKLRKDLYGYDFCVNCSTVEPKVGINMVYGEGDHTWNDIVVVDKATAKKIEERERATSKRKPREFLEEELEDISPVVDSMALEDDDFFFTKLSIEKEGD